MGCTPVVFNYASWVLMFPEFANLQEEGATGYFNMATLYIRNDGAGPVNDPKMQTTLLNLTTAHLAKLFSTQTNGQPTTGGAEGPAGLVGRIASASEGSVSVSTEYTDQDPSGAWWNQTPYGAAAWKLKAPFRTMRYLPTPRRRYNPPVGFRGF